MATTTVNKKVYTCEHCNNEFVSKVSLNSHLIKAKYCLKLRGFDVKKMELKNKCDGCDRCFVRKYEYNRHINVCKHYKYTTIIKDLQDKIKILENKNKVLEEKNLKIK